MKKQTDNVAKMKKAMKTQEVELEKIRLSMKS